MTAPTESTPDETAVPTSDEPWGRVDADGTVSVREGSEWREVGQFPDGSADEALAYFTRKYSDLANEITLLEVRHRRGGASASDLRQTAQTLQGKVKDAAAVGDLAALERRLANLLSALEGASAAEAQAAKEAVDAAIVERTGLVERAEAIAARDPKTVQWKQVSAELTELFDQWQAHQQNGPRLPKTVSQQLWSRFRDARSTVERHRRAFYAELDETHKHAKEAKTRLVERAEALAPRGEEGIPAYRGLLDEWKASGRAGKKVDDALWARFKAAGDALYGARIERESVEAEESKDRIEAKRALLERARPIIDVKDISSARQQLTAIQREWDEIGRIFPRDKERTLDDELRKVEQSVRTREDAEWKRNDPETTARANDMTRQLTDAIEKLEAELAAAEKTGDAKATQEARDALEARKAWLRAIGS
ncbi:DUF349 domain-containing protein [Microbacterium caowuchunii]|uniref:DUF349 domain-containing protein n=1 Tax=Microbacterium caowuchunii TaxID=2614638 RepID=A0A5N0TP77_9MICO|nr:DUF349 domain-containing protein [Microbacterium caowuchunii]KAA9135199.1 DUF349 domain-containing protein [Microbacterium caowuchunii]